MNFKTAINIFKNKDAIRKQKIAGYCRTWRKKNPEKFRKYMRNYIKKRYHSDPEFRKKILLTQKIWRQNHKEFYREYAKKWYAIPKNKKKRNEQGKKYYQAHKERWRNVYNKGRKIR